MYRNRSSGATRDVPTAEIAAKVEICIDKIRAWREAELKKAISYKMNQVNGSFLRRHGLRNLIDREAAHQLLKRPTKFGGSDESYINECYSGDQRALEELGVLCSTFDKHDLIALDTDTALVINKWLTK